MNTYEIVTEKIISVLEQGLIPWRRPWTATGLPRNLVTKRSYRGVNFFLLATIRSEKRMVVMAAAQAQKAADYVLNRESGVD
jgi:antirestriction protein ArdC